MTARTLTPFSLSLSRRRRKPGGVSLCAGLGLGGTLVAMSLLGWIGLPDPNQQNLAAGYQPPASLGHLLGTDMLGRDLLTWCLRGITTSLLIGAVVVALSACAGVLVGAAAGYLGGWADTVLMRLVDLQLAVPPLLIFLSAAAVIQPTATSMIVLLAAVGWVPYARLVRAKVLVERQRGYIAAARLAGTRRLGIVFGHLVPACATPITVFASLHVGFVVLSEAALSFIGIGLQPPTVSLGFMIAQGRDQLASAWWIATIPGLVIIVLIITTNLVGDGLRDRFQLDMVEAA